MRKRASLGNPLVAVAYLRVSTEDQSLGPDAQRAQIETWAKRQDVRIAAWHSEDVSGGASVDRRPALLAALADLRTLGAGILVAKSRDRLARDVVVAAVLEKMAVAAGAKVVTADGVSSEDTPEGALQRVLLDAFAAYERAQIRARTKAALQVKKMRGERLGSVPFGYRVANDGVHLALCPEEQTTIAHVHALRERRTIRGVAAECARIGLVSRSGRPLSATQVHRILSAVRVDEAAE